MKLHVGVGLEPVLVFLVGVEVVEDDVELSARKGRGDAVHEVEKLDAATSFGMRRDDLSGGDFEQPFKAMVGIAMPPKADNPRLDPNFLGYRPGAAPVRRQQNYLR